MIKMCIIQTKYYPKSNLVLDHLRQGGERKESTRIYDITIFKLIAWASTVNIAFPFKWRNADVENARGNVSRRY